MVWSACRSLGTVDQILIRLGSVRPQSTIWCLHSSVCSGRKYIINDSVSVQVPTTHLAQPTLPHTPTFPCKIKLATLRFETEGCMAPVGNEQC